MKITRNCFITAGDTAALWICYSVLWWSGDVMNISLTSLEWGTSFGQITLLRRDKWTKKIWSVWLRARKVRIKTRMFLQQEDGWEKWYQRCKWELLKWYYWWWRRWSWGGTRPRQWDNPVSLRDCLIFSATEDSGSEEDPRPQQGRCQTAWLSVTATTTAQLRETSGRNTFKRSFAL